MSVSKDEVSRIAELARLRPDERAIERLTRELNGILDHIQVLESVELEEIGGDEETSAASSGFRPREIEADRLGDRGPEGMAPAWREGFFLVPRLPALDQGVEPDSGEGPDGAER